MVELDVYRVLPGTPTKPGHYAVLTTSAATPSQRDGDATGSKSASSASTTTVVSTATVVPSTPPEHGGNATGSESPTSPSTSTTTVADAAKPDQSAPPDFTLEQVYMGDALRDAHKVRGTHTLHTALIAAGTLVFAELSDGGASVYANPYVSGGEFTTAMDMARKARIPVLLGDRPFPETLLRAAQEFWTSDIKGSVNLLDEFSFNSPTDRAGGKMGGARRLTDSAKSVLVGERDAHMADVTAHCMAQRKSKSTVMIVGGKHQAGIVSDLCKKHGFKLESRSVPLPVSIWGWGA
ncbi:hypothetical protein JKP88DRAFT_290193 [Tribonema minus]|uniref:Uncharacterized protein n=1 Tax=Tribonema minus TaxID=303371 RepID=A0A835YY02_9STRA|nr:hypothetical protein JKP88DRAFT_290193 [Tribonema minus]